MKNSNETIGNRTRNLPACSAVPQPTKLPRTPDRLTLTTKNSEFVSGFAVELVTSRIKF